MNAAVKVGSWEFKVAMGVEKLHWGFGDQSARIGVQWLKLWDLYFAMLCSGKRLKTAYQAEWLTSAPKHSLKHTSSFSRMF